MKKIHKLSSIFTLPSSSNQRGFTLVEIMVAIGIMSTISLALIKMNEMMNKTSKNMSQQLDATQLMGQLNFDLKNTSGCFNTFGLRTLANGGVATTSLRNAANTELFAVPGGVFGDLTFVSATFRDVGPLDGVTVTIVDPAAAPATIDVQMRTATVRFQLRKGRNANAEVDHQQTVGTRNLFKDLTFKFYVLPGTPNFIRACSGDDSEYLSLACALFNGTLSGTTCRNITVSSITTTTGVAATFTERVAIARTGAPAANSLLEIGSGTYPVGTLPGLNIAGDGNSYMTISDNTRQVLFGVDTSLTGMVGTYSNHDFVVRSNNIERIRVTAAGNVGVGISPTERLHVGGNSLVTGNSTTNGNLTVIGQSTLTGVVNTNTTLSIGNTMGAATQGLCYKGTCITSWRVVKDRAQACWAGTSVANGRVNCPSGMFMTEIATYNYLPGLGGNYTTIACCPIEVR
jgi:prepilin-type N-terminal cleavage/methylation domain-containing protein